MKALKKALFAILLSAGMLFAVTAPMKVEAASNVKFITVAPGTWMTTSNASDNYTCYKVRVTAPGELTFKLKADSYNSYPMVEVYRLKKKLVNAIVTSHRNTSEFELISNNSSNKSIQVDKGTYYLCVYGKCKFAYTKAVNKPNYTLAAAHKLNPSTKIKIIQTPLYNYPRWYRVRTTARQKISFWSNTSDHASSIQIYNGFGRKLKTVQAGSELKYCTETKQPAGNYYIRVPSYYRYTDDSGFGQAYTLMWK